MTGCALIRFWCHIGDQCRQRGRAVPPVRFLIPALSFERPSTQDSEGRFVYPIMNKTILAFLFVAASWRVQVAAFPAGDGTVTGSTGTIGQTPSQQAFTTIKVNVKDLGAKCDGATDDTMAFVTAFGLVTSPSIYIPPGTCVISPRTYVAASSVSISGDDAGTSIVQLARGSEPEGNLFAWTNRSRFSLHDFTLDLNGAKVSSLTGAVAITGGSYVRVENMRILNGGSPWWLLISINGALHGWITGNYLQLTTPSAIQNQAINLSSSYATTDDWHIEQNVMVNTGSILTGSNLIFCRNEVLGWNYGAGVSTGMGESTPGTIICHNRFHDSGTAIDTDRTYPNGIESWGTTAVIANNDIFNVAAGVYIGGRNTQVVGNCIRGTGKRVDGIGTPGITAGYVNPTLNSSGSKFIGNVVQDDGAGTTTYGYADAAGTVGITLQGNALAGRNGAIRILGGTHVLEGLKETRVDKTCFAVDQRMTGD
jgi:Pectate lyase superfamily protein